MILNRAVRRVLHTFNVLDRFELFYVGALIIFILAVI
ncbi:hypothetical protein PMI29_00549 [Pseudomonas sp. GM49]|nr:hypothetical protein PMI29_00549 [Pseudomonas sp. GM49]